MQSILRGFSAARWHAAKGRAIQSGHYPTFLSVAGGQWARMIDDEVTALQEGTSRERRTRDRGGYFGAGQPGAGSH